MSIIKELINTHFNENLGFGKHKDIAIKLLKETTQILDEYNIDYFLISGTLLGYVRHNDFIPWDDDMDLIVDASFLDKLQEINKNKNNNIQFIEISSCKWIIKSCYAEKIIHDWPKSCNWNWPFIDLFIYGNTDDNNMNFFNKTWSRDKFFPKQTVSFLGIPVSIPNDPHYFLKINYGSKYMTIYKSSDYCHKYERPMGNTVEMSEKILKRNM